MENEKLFELMTKMYSKMQNGFKRVDEQLKKVDERFANIDERFNKLDAKVDKNTMLLEKANADIKILAEVQQSVSESSHFFHAAIRSIMGLRSSSFIPGSFKR